MYHLSHSAQMDHHLLPASSPAGDFESAQPYIPDGTTQHNACPGARRRGLHVDRDVAPVSAVCTRSHRSSLAGMSGALADEDTDTLRDVCQNYHELAVVARSWWLRANPILPFHLGALEVIDRALRGSFSPKA
jgi:hypothetical protein